VCVARPGRHLQHSSKGLVVPVQQLWIAASTAKSSNSGSGFFLLLILLLGVFLLYRFSASQRRARTRAADLRSSVLPGQEVMTSSGLYGTVISNDDDVVELQVADGVVVKFAKAAVTKVIKAVEPGQSAYDAVPDVEVPPVFADDPHAESPRTSSEG
jgi:preprotein translocase subunit YajC